MGEVSFPMGYFLGGRSGRNPIAAGVERDSVDVVATSPPYPNNIDYSEVYKLETWLLGFIQSGASFLNLRKGSLRSHPSSELKTVNEKELLSGCLRATFEPFFIKLNTEEEVWRRKLFIGYFSDLKVSLREYHLVLKKGGRAFITVGNSLHGGKYHPYLIATDLLLAELAASVGFRVDEVAIARSLKRRLSGNHFLRESVVVLTK
jgi:DNA modification methylase